MGDDLKNISIVFNYMKEKKYLFGNSVVINVSSFAASVVFVVSAINTIT